MNHDVQKFHIAVVDDEAINIKLIVEALKEEYTFSVATSGEEALMIIEQRPPDLILLDIEMPDMDGYAVLEKLQADENTKRIPVIIVTARDGNSDESKGLDMGAVDFITKPFVGPIVRARVKTHIDLKNFSDSLISLVQERTTDLFKANLKLEENNKTLEQVVNKRTKSLSLSLEKIKSANSKVVKSIKYARNIQRAMLPSLDAFRANIPDSFVIWRPRDIVGGDTIYADYTRNGLVAALVDCTGHGVPGAFMSMIASSGLRQIVSEDGCSDPAEILKKLNSFVKKSLRQDHPETESDDGMDVALCYFDKRQHTLTFAGAQLPLYLIDDGELKFIPGDRHSLGYKKSNLDFTFTNHKIQIDDKMSFYFSTDGFIDQTGGEKDFSFGKKRFKNLLLDNYKKPYTVQEEEIMRALNVFRGENEILDDITIMGCSLAKYNQTVILAATIIFHDISPDVQSQAQDILIKKINSDIRISEGQIVKNSDGSIVIFFINDPDSAIGVAVVMQEKLNELKLDNQQVKNGIDRINTGIYTCPIGIRTFEDINAIGEIAFAHEVLLTQRLSGLNEEIETNILICDTTLSKFGNILSNRHRFIGRVKVEEKREDLAVFEIFSANSKDTIANSENSLEEYDRGIFYYNTKNFKRAAKSFQRVLESYPKDVMSAIYLEKSEYFLRNESPQNWEFIAVISL